MRGIFKELLCGMMMIAASYKLIKKRDCFAALAMTILITGGGWVFVNSAG